MKPYWQSDDGRIVLYHGDCLEILPAVAGDAVVTDPPYNVGIAYGPSVDDRREHSTYLAWLQDVFVAGARAVGNAGSLVWFWPSIYVTEARDCLPDGWRIHHVAAWYKREFAGDLYKAEHPAFCWEPIIWAVPEGWSPRYYGAKGGHAGRDCIVANHARHDGIIGHHPCPKPLSVMQTVLSWVVPPTGVVIDPFAGSGTTLVAAHRLGMRAVGIEIEERFCEIARARLEAEVRQMRLPVGDVR